MEKPKQSHVQVDVNCNHEITCKPLNEQRTYKSYTNSLTSREMDSLTALCDTFLPSLDGPIDENDSINRFFKTSASMAGVPETVGSILSGRLKHPKTWLFRVALWFMSTWIGTLVLCGRVSLSKKFPYVQKLSQVSAEKREEIVKSWSLGFFVHLRMLFKGIKLLILLVFFTQVDEENENVSWKAIDYKGPDPNFKSKSSKGENLEDKQRQDEDHQHEYDNEQIFGPLHKGIVNINHPLDAIAKTLEKTGFPASVLNNSRSKSSQKFSKPSLTVKCDVVVIGSGSGGGVVAGVLAKAGYRVLVLEKGNYRARSNLSLLEGQSLEDMYLGGGLLGTDDGGAVILAGSTVGGGSTINWSASIRTPDHVRKEWCDCYGLEMFESKLYNEALDVVTEKMGVQNEVQEEGFNNAILRKGCEELGYPVTDVPQNSSSDHYCGWCCFGCKDGKKKGTLETWLVDLVNSGNGAILPGCEAIKVTQKYNRMKKRRSATGVEFQFQQGGIKHFCIAESKVTVVACGAICTPSLLKRSGLKNRNIGRNLHLHPATMAWGYFPDAKLKSYEGGILTSMSSVVGNFDGLAYGSIIQTPALHPGMFSVVMPWVSGLDFKARMCRFSKTAHIFTLARDKGSGIVSSPNTISYQMDKLDRENLKIGLEKVMRILVAAGAEEIGTHHCKGRKLNVKVASSHDFERFVKEESWRTVKDFPAPICSAHQMGTCRMGIEPKESAVNQMGETWEVEGLYVADTSVFPTALGVNPMVTVQAIAYCTAQSVLQVLKRKEF